MAAVPTKQYGLILPQKKDGLKSNLKKPSVFGDDSDEETSVGESLQKEAIKKKMMKQTRLEMQKALEEDSTVYDYDAVYDDIQKQRSENVKKVLSATDKRPKYIHQLMAAVKDRKKEQDQRKIRKEREAEGDKFSDKEAYITSAYKKKLQEEEEEEERDRRRAEMEAALDVKKQQDLSGFYRHLLNQTIGEEKVPDRAQRYESAKVSKETEGSPPPPSSTSPATRDNVPSSCSDSEEGHEHKSVFNKLAAGSAHSKRQYRQRSPTSGSGDDRDRDRDRERQSKSHRDRDRHRDRERDRDRNRVKERDDRHGGRRDDRDRREDRGREDDRDRREDRGREDDRSRGRGDAERDDRSGRRGRSPRDRKRNRSGEREKRRSATEDERKDKEAAEGKEEDKDKPTTDERKGDEEEGGDGDEVKEDAAEKVNKFAKRSTDQAVSSARDRYLARQVARAAAKTYIEKEDD